MSLDELPRSKRDLVRQLLATLELPEALKADLRRRHAID